MEAEEAAEARLVAVAKATLEAAQAQEVAMLLH